MKIAIRILKHYTIGIIVALLIIGIIHVYSYFFEAYFTSAQWDNIIETALISGFPFGIATWVFINLKKMTEGQEQRSNNKEIFVIYLLKK